MNEECIFDLRSPAGGRQGAHVTDAVDIEQTKNSPPSPAGSNSATSMALCPKISGSRARDAPAEKERRCSFRSDKRN